MPTILAPFMLSATDGAQIPYTAKLTILVLCRGKKLPEFHRKQWTSLWQFSSKTHCMQLQSHQRKTIHFWLFCYVRVSFFQSPLGPIQICFFVQCLFCANFVETNISSQVLIKPTSISFVSYKPIYDAHILWPTVQL